MPPWYFLTVLLYFTLAVSEYLADDHKGNDSLCFLQIAIPKILDHRDLYGEKLSGSIGAELPLKEKKQNTSFNRNFLSA